MEYEIACRCGKVIPVSDGMAGSSVDCACGETFLVPSLTALQQGTVADVPTPHVSYLPPPAPTKPVPKPNPEIIAPTQVSLRVENGATPSPRVRGMAALTANGLWIQEIWRLRSVPLHGLEIEGRLNGKELVLKPAPGSAGETLSLTFDTAREGRRWSEEIRSCQSKLDPDAPPELGFAPEGVALVTTVLEVRHVSLGRVAFVHRSTETADRGIQLRGGILGADAIIEVSRKKVPEMGPGARKVTGLAVRVADGEDRNRLRWKWYAEEVSSLTRGILILLVIQVSLLFLATAFAPGKSRLHAATGETSSESIASAALGVALFFTWPLIMVILLRVLRWREILRATGLAVLAVTTARGLTVVAAHFAAVSSTGTTLDARKIGLVLDPVDWAFIVVGGVLCARAWHLAHRASRILPEEAQVVSVPRKLWSRGLLATSVVIALICVGFAGVSRYEQSAYLFQEGVDPRREHEGLLALNEGATHANQGDLQRAEASFQRSLKLWEELTARRSVPWNYRANLATTLNNLGWIRLRQARKDEAEKYYSRAVALADQLAGDPQLDEDTKKVLAGARTVLAELRRDQSAKLLDEKEQEAVRKYEEAEVKEGKEDLKAEGLYRECIATWESILSEETTKEYRKSTVARLATACLVLGDVQVRLGKRPEAESNLKKAIDYGEKAVDLDPARPLPRHNLDVARQRLEGMHQQAFQEEVDKLNRAGRFADAIDHLTRGIKEQDERLRAGKGLETVVPSLAYRLDALAWLLAHCPDRRLRDTKASVEHARRATSLRPDVGDYWYTLAMVQYRNGDWRDSLGSLDTLKARRGEFDASDLLLSAMNLHRLGRKPEARSAVVKAVRWMGEKSRKAEGDAMLRMEYELMRPGFESLLREARGLIEGESINRGKEA
jgi:tetratricopeptide (TPR) repeat protein